MSNEKIRSQFGRARNVICSKHEATYRTCRVYNIPYPVVTNVFFTASSPTYSSPNRATRRSVHHGTTHQVYQLRAKGNSLHETYFVQHSPF